MSLYKETNIAGSEYVRTNRVILDNPISGKRIAHYIEEKIINLDNNDTLKIPKGELTFDVSNLSTIFPLYNPETGNPIPGQFSNYSTIHHLLYSAYIYQASKRDKLIPIFSTIPKLNAYVDAPYRFDVLIVDNDTDATNITINYVEKPAWLSFSDYGDKTAVLSGTPSINDVGNVTVKLSASDGSITEYFEYTLNVSQTTIPIFISEPILTATENVLYTYNITVIDDSIVNLSCITKPTWLSFIDNGNNTAILSGTPSSEHIGMINIDIEILADDSTRITNQDFTIEVIAA